MPNEEQKISSCCEGCDCGCIKHPNLHPCETLVNLFREKPYQGAPPDQAKMLFVGLDANYDEHLGENPFFRYVKEYHNDGVQFWRKHGFHHPFLSPEYKYGSGYKYHKNFGKIGFKPEHASQISFIELFHLPTFGVNELKARHLCKKHLEKITNWIENGSNKHVFLSAKLIELMKEKKLLSERLNTSSRNYYDNEQKILKILYEDKSRNIKIYKHFHFSSSKTPQKQLETKAIRKLMDE